MADIVDMMSACINDEYTQMRYSCEEGDKLKQSRNNVGVSAFAQSYKIKVTCRAS